MLALTSAFQTFTLQSAMCAEVVKSADTIDSKSIAREGVWVRLPPSAQESQTNHVWLFVCPQALSQRNGEPAKLQLPLCVRYLRKLHYWSVTRVPGHLKGLR
jgi:hypothetical protein